MTATLSPQLNPVHALPREAALVVDHAVKRFSVGAKRRPMVAIDDVSMRLERGEIYGILGSNGSGKSTLIRLICGLLTLDAGRVEIFGHDLVREETDCQAPDQPGLGGRGLLQEAEPAREPELRRSSLRPRRSGTARIAAVEILGRLGISERAARAGPSSR